jgi:hypothetical protein
MMGIGVSFTPKSSGNFLITVNGSIGNTVSPDGATVGLRYGTGAAPENGKGPTGTLLSFQFAASAVNAQSVPFSMSYYLPGLTINTAYWLDLSLAAFTGGSASVINVYATVYESWVMLWLVLLLLVWAPGAWAQPASCVDEIAVWTTPYSAGNIQTVSYFMWQQAPPRAPGLLAVLYRTGEFHLHVGVPLSVAQPFTSAPTADGIYNSRIKRAYHQALLAETLCPLLNEKGAFLLGEVPWNGRLLLSLP